MTTNNVRATNGRNHVLVANTMSHLHGRNQGRECPHCQVLWTVSTDEGGSFQIWRNGQSADDAILDWMGNNVAIECCSSST